MTAPTEMHYIGDIPSALPEGQVLVHNHIKPHRVLGRNGFRAWTQRQTADLADLELCVCDWAGVDLHGFTHYRVASLGRPR